MNKIFSIVRNSHGQLVVANEYAKSPHGSSKMKTGLTKLTGVLIGAFLTMGIATAQEVLNHGGLAGGVASGNSSIAIGESSWTTSEHGSSAGAGSIATGGDMTREQFEELLKSIEDVRKAREEKLKERAQVAVKINSNIKQIQDLNTTIKGYDELIKQNQQNQDAIQNLQSQIDTKNNAKDALIASQAFKDAEANYTKYQEGILGRNINEYANFSLLINGLSWTKAPPEGKTLTDTLAEELSERIKLASPAIYEKYKQEDTDAGKGVMERYIDYVKKYNGEWGYRQGITDGLKDKYQNTYTMFNNQNLYIPQLVKTGSYSNYWSVYNPSKETEYSYQDVVGLTSSTPLPASSNLKVYALNGYLHSVTKDTLNNILDESGVLDFSKSNLTMMTDKDDNEIMDRMILFNSSLGKKIKSFGANILSNNFYDTNEYTDIMPNGEVYRIASKNSNKDIDGNIGIKYFEYYEQYGKIKELSPYRNTSFYNYLSPDENNNTTMASIGGIYGGLGKNTKILVTKKNAYLTLPESITTAIFSNTLISSIDFIEQKNKIQQEIQKESRINSITSENFFALAPEVKFKDGFDDEKYNELFNEYKVAEAKNLN